MKLFLSAIAGMLFATTLASAQQNYQTQGYYPSDPYSGTPQASYQQPSYQSQGGYGGYEGYSAPTYTSGGGGGYDKQSYNYGSTGGVSGRYGNILSWDNLEVYYAYNDFRGDDKIEGDSGFGADLRVKLMNPIFLHFGLDRITGSAPNAKDISITSFTAGAGVFVPIGSRFQLFGEVGLRYDYTSGALEYINTDDISLYVRPGVRFALTERIELAASVVFNDTENLNDRAVEVTGYYAITNWLDFLAGVDFGSDINTYRLGGRWRWD